MFARLEKALELPGGTNFIDVVRRLNADLDIPRGLGAMGVTEAMIPALAEAAVRDVNTLTNPVRLDAAGYEDLLRAAM